MLLKELFKKIADSFIGGFQAYFIKESLSKVVHQIKDGKYYEAISDTEWIRERAKKLGGNNYVGKINKIIKEAIRETTEELIYRDVLTHPVKEISVSPWDYLELRQNISYKEAVKSLIRLKSLLLKMSKRLGVDIPELKITDLVNKYKKEYSEEMVEAPKTLEELQRLISYCGINEKVDLFKTQADWKSLQNAADDIKFFIEMGGAEMPPNRGADFFYHKAYKVGLMKNLSDASHNIKTAIELIKKLGLGFSTAELEMVEQKISNIKNEFKK